MERFKKLYGTVYRDMYRLAFYYLGNADDAEDAVQDAALAAYENFSQLQDEENFRSWIFQILVNRCRKALRRRGRREGLLISLHAGRGEAAGGRRTERAADPLEELAGTAHETMILRAELLEALDRLSREERLLVTLAVFGGYKGAEIAQILGKKHSTVRSKYRRALKKLEEALTPEGQPDHAGKEA